MRSTSPRLLLWAIPLALLGAAFTQAGAAADTQLGWSWDQVSIRQTPAGEAKCEVAGARFHYAKPGEPDLPALLVEIPAPERSRPASFEIAGAVTSDRDLEWPIAPAIEDRPSEAGGPVAVSPLASAYQASSYPSERVQFLGISLKRGTAWANFAVYPLTLERGRTLILLEEGTLTVRWQSDPSIRAPLKSLRPESGDLQRDFTTPATITEEGSAQLVSDRPSLSGSAVRYVVIAPAAYADSLQQFVNWKNQTGTPTVLRTVDWIYQNFPEGVDKAERIRNFLIEAYRYWGAEYLLVVGGPDEVPIRVAKYIGYSPPAGMDIITDYYYACLDGTWNADGDAIFGEAQIPNWNPVGDDVDFAPELIVGRVPAKSLDQLHNWLGKYWKYVRNPNRAGYLDRTLMMGEVLFNAAWRRALIGRCDEAHCPLDCDHVCVDMDGADDCVTAVNIMDGSSVHMDHTELYEYFEYWQRNGRPNAIIERKSIVLDSLTAGAGWIQHVGHGNFDRISVGTDDGLSSQARILSADVRSSIHNAGKPGILYSINCTSAAINEDCVASAFLFAPDAGVVTYVGSSNLDFPSTARYYQTDFWTKCFVDKIPPGVAFSQSLDENARNLGNDENYRRFLTYSLIYLGDPQMVGWLGTPGILSVSGAGQMTLGDSTYAVTVTRGGNPLPGAKVCAYKTGDVYGVATTGGNGVALVPFRPTTSGGFSVWVTEAGSVPKPVSPAPSVVAPGGSVSSVLATGLTIIDGSAGGQPRTGTTGNANGRLEVGETVDLDLSVKNVGSAAASNVLFTLSADSMLPYIQIIKGSHTANVPANGTATLTGAFRVRVRSITPEIYYQNLDRLPFDTNVIVHDGSRSQAFDLPLYAYRPVFRLLSADAERSGGVPDSIPNNGETWLWKPLFRNIGTGTIANMRAYFSAVSGAFVESDSADFEGPAEQGSSVSMIQSFTFRVDDETNLSLALTVRSTLQRDVVFFTREIHFGRPDPASYFLDDTGNPRRLQTSKDAIAVVWQKSTSTDVQGYVLKRASDPNGTFLPVAGDLLTRMEYYRDEGLAGLTRYYYKIAAVDSSGNQSLDTGVISATTSPPILEGWPVTLGDVGYGCPTIENIDKVEKNEIFVNSDLMYAYKSDGNEVFDGDHLSTTSGVWSTNGFEFWGKPAIADLDNDGVVDIVATSRRKASGNTEGAQILVWKSNGDLRWQKTVGGVNLISSPVIANIDADPDYEILYQNDGSIYAWNPDGTPVISGNANGLLKQVSTVTFTYGSLAVADLDDDGSDETIYAYGPGGGTWSRLSVVKYDGATASVLSTVDIDAAGPCQSSPAVLKWNGDYEIFVDARTRIVGYRWDQGTNSLQMMWAVGNGGLPNPNPYDPSVAIGDVSGDGTPDIVAPGGFAKIYAVDSQTGASIFVPFRPGNSSTVKLGSPILIDLDNDPSAAEIVIGDNSGTVYAFRGTSGHAGESLPGFPFAVGGGVVQGLTCWDLDKDGHPELMIQANTLPAVTTLQLTNVTFPARLEDRMAANPWTSFRHDARNTGRYDAHVVTPVATMSAEGSGEAGAAVVRWNAPLHPETFRIERSGLDGVWSTRAEGSPSTFQDGQGDGQAYAYRDETDPGTYSYRVLGLDGTGRTMLQSWEVQVTVLPLRLRLIGAVPNPFNPRTTIRFESPSGTVQLDIVDLAGRHVRSLFSGTVRPGTHDIVWDGRDDAQREISSGIYFARLHGSAGMRSQKVVLLR